MRALATFVLLAAFPALAQPPPITPLRSGESYTYLAGRDSLSDGARTPLDGIKYVRLGAWGEGDASLSLGGEVRLRPYALTSAGLAPDADDGAALVRVAAHADLRLGARLRAFAQLYSASRAGGDLPDPLARDDLTLHEAFAELAPLAGPGLRLALRVGRQEHPLGSGRLIGLREGPNVRLAFDAARVLIEVPTTGGAIRLDAFVQRPVEIDPGVFDDGAVTGAVSWGVHGAGPVRTGVAPEAYYVGHTADPAFSSSGPRKTTRHTFGARLATAPGSALTVDAEVALQLGTAGPVDSGSEAPSVDVRALMVAGGLAYRLDALPLRPEPGLLIDFATGDSDPDDDHVGTFEAPHPNNQFFGLAGLVGGFKNLLHVKPRLVLQPSPRLTLTASAAVYYRVRVADPAYGPSTRPAFGAEPGRALPEDRRTGPQLFASAEVRAHRYLTLTLDLERFVPGPYVRSLAPGARAQTYVAATALARF